MYPQASNLFDGRWGSFWFVGRTNGRWFLYETAGPVVFVQLQRLLSEAVLPTDRTYDGSVIGPTAFAIDGVIGTNSMRRLWALASKRGMDRGTLDMISAAARSRPSTTRMSPALLQVMLSLLYPSLVRFPGEAQLSIAPNGAPMIGSAVGLPISTTAQVQASPSIFTAMPTSAPFDAGVPATPIASIEALRDTRSGVQVKFSAPWTTFEPPVVLGPASPTTFTPLPATGEGGISPLPPQPGQVSPIQPMPPAPQSGWSQQIAGDVTQVGAKALPALPYVAAAAVGVAAVWLLAKLR